MAALTLADYFDGNVQDEEYAQPCAKDGMGRWSGIHRVQQFTFTGVPTSIKDQIGSALKSVTVTDISGKQYTLSLVPKDEDSSTGTAWFSKEIVRISKSRMSYHMWIISVQRTGGELLLNGATFYSGPSWMYE